MFPFVYRNVLLALLLFLLHGLQAQNCNPDVTPPVAVCEEFLSVTLDGTGQDIVLSADVFDNGSFDACCLDTLLIQRQFDGPCDGDELPDDYTGSIAFCCADAGSTFFVLLKALDCSGNFNECITQVEVQDKIMPFCLAPANVTVTCDNFDPTLAAYGLGGGADNCCLDTVVTTVSYTQFDTLCTKGVIARTFQALDCNANSAQCTQRITVVASQDYSIRFPDDIVTDECNNDPNGYGIPEVFGEDCELIGMSYTDQVFPNVPGLIYKIERTWVIINWCTYNPVEPVITVPNPTPNAIQDHPSNLPGPIVSAPLTPAPWAATVVKVNPGDPAPTDYSSFYSTSANGYTYRQIIRIGAGNQAKVTGKVFLDSIANCTYDTGERGLADWKVRITAFPSGTAFEVTPDAAGDYAQVVCAQDTAVEITLAAPFNYGQDCPTTYTVSVAPDQIITQHVPVKLNGDCPLLYVEMATPFLRRCFDNNYYAIQTCNLSAETIENAFAAVTLDPYFDFISATLPANSAGGNTFTVELGDLEPGACVQFNIFFLVDCAAPLGASHCSEVHVFPDTLCPANANWSGADVRVSAACDGDSVRLQIRNQGVGDMQESLEFIVVEDVIMYQSNQFQLNSGDMTEIAVPATGATWRLEAQQVPFHPFGGPEAVALEGCGGINTTGLVEQMPVNSRNPFIANDCRQNIGAYDPNDKQVFPTGYGAEHLVEANVNLDYLIRFQNTGTDTAFTVVILDTLSSLLDIAGVRSGPASHAYDFAVLDGNVLRFSFNNIMLPDSNVNEPASNGFVKFSVKQQPDLTDGVRIENSAAIYFDFNEPVITNTTFLTIGDHFILVNVDPVPGAQSLRAYPNPARDAVFFDLPVSGGDLILSDQFGRVVRVRPLTETPCRLACDGLAPGLYYWRVTGNGAGNFSGKLVIK